MLFASLGLNVVILVPVLISIWNNTAGIEVAFGADTEARRILAGLYFAIAAISLGQIILSPTG